MVLFVPVCNSLLHPFNVIFGLTPIISRALYCLKAHFHCSDPSYLIQERKDTVVYIM